MPAGLVEAIYLDHATRLWVATDEGGVARIDAPEAERPGFFTYSTANGLATNQGMCVTEDQWGMIYMGTGRGVDKLDPATGYIRHYTTADGLASSYVFIAFRQRDDSLWFGTLQGSRDWCRILSAKRYRRRFSSPGCALQETPIRFPS